MNNHSPSELTLATRVTRNPDLIGTEMDGELVMMSIEKGSYYGISGIGPRVWELLETPTTGQVMCDTIRQEYAVTQEQCEQDVMNFLNGMFKNGLLVVG
jgi:hypothetical protein